MNSHAKPRNCITCGLTFKALLEPPKRYLNHGLHFRCAVRRSAFELPGAKTVLMLGHVDVLAAEANAFELQAGSLFKRSLVLQLDGTTGADDALPGQRATGLAQ